MGYIGAWLIVNLGNNIATGAFSGIIPDLVPHSERGYASGMMAVMQQVGTIGGLAIGALLVPQHDGLATALIAAILAGIALVTVSGVREQPLPHAEPFRLSELKDCFWVDPRQHPDFAWVWVQRALFTLGWNLIQTNLLFFIADVVNKKPPETTFGVLGMIVLLGAVPTGLVCGGLSDRIGRKPIIFVAGMAMALTGVAFAGLGALPEAVRLPLLYGLGILWGFGYGAYISVDWALGTDVLPSADDAGKDMGVWHLSMTLPMSLAAPAGALLLKPFAVPGGESYQPAGYTVLFLVGSALLALCAVLIWRVKKAR
jgi:MFS family permease